MSMNPVRLYAQPDGTVLDEEGNVVELVTPGPGQSEAAAPSSASSANVTVNDKMSHDQLDTLAADNGVRLGDATTKAEKVKVLRDAGF